jgi:hypothetical protein
MPIVGHGPRAMALGSGQYFAFLIHRHLIFAVFSFPVNTAQVMASSGIGEALRET